MSTADRPADAWVAWRKGTVLSAAVAERLALGAAAFAPDRAMKFVEENAHAAMKGYSINNATYDRISHQLDAIRAGCEQAAPESARQWRELATRLRDTYARKPNFVARMNALLAT